MNELVSEWIKKAIKALKLLKPVLIEKMRFSDE